MTNDLTFTGKMPVVINKNTSSTDLFEPIRSSSCDITIVSSKILSDLYTNDKTGIIVKVEKISGEKTNTLFEGYMTPNTYSQHISPNLDSIEMTAIDPLATLKYIYIDSIVEKSQTIKFGVLLGKIFAEVMIDAKYLLVENTVLYDNTQTVLDLQVQTSNFWDEGDNSMSCYDVLAECLRLFGLTITLTGEYYAIYSVITDHNFSSSNKRSFTRYGINDNGTLTRINQPFTINMTDKWFRHLNGDWTTIDDNPTVSIDDTYDRIFAIASTKIPEYNQTAFDLIDPQNRDLYDAGDVNIDLNPIKGYNSSGAQTASDWYYIWNGVYTNPDFNLKINGGGVSGYANINNIFAYMTGLQGISSTYGGMLNYYGGEENLTNTEGKNPTNERSVEINECITFFAPDNGTTPEFLQKDDLKWSYSKTGISAEYNNNGSDTYTKSDKTNAKYGTSTNGISGSISYNQKYENIVFSKNSDMVMNIELSHKFSRTGVDIPIILKDYSTVSSPTYQYIEQANDNPDRKVLVGGTAYTIPWTWQSNNVVVDEFWFERYKVGSGTSIGIKEVWDKRPVYLYYELEDGTKYQFNGETWVKVDVVSNANCFYFKKLMNEKKIYNEEIIYDVIQCSNGTNYSLNEDGFTYYKASNNRVSPTEKSGFTTTVKYDYYLKKDNKEIRKWISQCSDGSLSIKLPAVDAINVKVVCEVFNSSLLGSTGRTTNEGTYNYFHNVFYYDNGVKYTTADTVRIDFTPYNVSYIKAEHIDLNLSLSVDKSNLGQMFGESDIEYQTNHSKKFRNTYDAPKFLVNTKHNLVTNSQSYVVANGGFADPSKFSFGYNTKVNSRPENYVLQGYKNFYSPIRRIYNRVLVPHKTTQFDNFITYIEIPDLPDYKWFVVISDSWDVKTNRHTICSVEDFGINIDEIDQNYSIIEIPRESRSPRYNLVSVMKTSKETIRRNTKATI